MRIWIALVLFVAAAYASSTLADALFGRAGACRVLPHDARDGIEDELEQCLDPLSGDDVCSCLDGSGE